MNEKKKSKIFGFTYLPQLKWLQLYSIFKSNVRNHLGVFLLKKW